MKTVKKRLEGDLIDCCDEPPPTCPRRYCSIAFRSFERSLGMPEPMKKKASKKKGKEKR